LEGKGDSEGLALLIVCHFVQRVVFVVSLSTLVITCFPGGCSRPMR